ILAAVGVVGVVVLGDALPGGPPVVVDDAAFLGPAVVFALALGAMEEVAYRGALLHWLARNVGTWVALAAQALVYGVAHAVAAPGAPLLTGTVLGAGALVAGVITIRTRSLLVPIAWHSALNLALYASLACRG
ncbi:MAG: CPBP family intramembrane glutamic endopeptidase, partial [Chloroflexota bacterium]